MAQEATHISYNDFQKLSTGIDMEASLRIIDEIKSGKEFIVEDKDTMFRVVVDNEDNLTLEKMNS